MIVARIIGGLGNQMFEYAAARAASLRNNIPLRLDLNAFQTYDLHEYGLNNFNIVAQVARPSEYVVGNPKSIFGRVSRRLGFRTRLEIYLENGLAFDSKVLALADNTYLDGYWQCERYFSDFEKQIRDDFHFKSAPDTVNQTYLNQINSVNAVSVHIRRGDYVNNPTVNAIHGLCDIDYYQRAVEFLYSRIQSKNLHFFVFSDDPGWVKRNINLGLETTFVSHNDASKNYEDMRLMSTCNHHIIANSSFSWWGAWLNPSKEKIVIAPKQWFKSNTLSSADIVPDLWNRL